MRVHVCIKPPSLPYDGTVERKWDAGLAHCPRLTTLDLGGNATITDAGLAHCPLLPRSMSFGPSVER